MPIIGSPAGENSSPGKFLNESAESIPVLLSEFLIRVVSGSSFFEQEEKPKSKKRNEAAVFENFLIGARILRNPGGLGNELSFPCRQ